MEEVVDKLIKELEQFANTPAADGGAEGTLDIQSIYWGDPGILPVYNYPALLVQPTRDIPAGETTGYEKRDLEILITCAIDFREFFDKDTDEATGDRQLVRTALALNRWLRRTANRRLDGEAGNVREVSISGTQYVPEIRGEVVTKTAQLTLTVNKQYQRES